MREAVGVVVTMRAIDAIAIPAVMRRLRGEGWAQRYTLDELATRARIMDEALRQQADRSAVVQQLFPFRDRERA